jgi:acyl transferase domain-containing protein
LTDPDPTVSLVRVEGTTLAGTMEGTLDRVAIVGMSGRFPGAPDLDAFWRNLRAGADSLAPFTEEELLADGELPAALADPAYVRAGRVLAGIEEFDADFFGYSPREAALLDPQQRLFLEAAWNALEDAGCTPEGRRAVAVYAGTSLGTYLIGNLCGSSGARAATEDLVSLLGNDKDFLASRVSFHLNLRGPSVAVQSGCSTSLVAVAQAFQALASHQCDLALAGGVSIRVPQRRGYRFAPEGILSPDGRCRPFDAGARGTSFGSGLGVVVLKRLSDALADGDRIRAVLLGAAVNNDGASKPGYTAPSVDGQAEVIAMAQALAGVEPGSIGYVEAHGTATALGDPLEVAALQRAFRGAPRGSCALGSVKGNVGHLDVASGIAGLIKTVLALEHEELPPSLHFASPNPACELDGSPFRVVERLEPWPRGGAPRRAGVSSFGMGGTNAHVVLEEAPPRAAGPPARACQILVLSARSAGALAARRRDLAQHLERHPELGLADVACTLQLGRAALEHRAAFACADRTEALARLRAEQPSVPAQPAARPLAWLFGGAPAAGAGRELLASEPAFRRGLDAARAALARLGLDADPLDPPDPFSIGAPETAAARAVALELALAELLLDWGVRPDLLAGRGAGALSAAVAAGALDAADALGLALLHGRAARDPAARRELRAALRDAPWRAPRIPLRSAAGGALSAHDLSDAERWLAELDSQEAGAAPADLVGAAVLELGPALLEVAALCAAVAALWAAGAAVDWRAFQRRERRLRVGLPTYPFERRRFWIAPPGAGQAAEGAERSADPARWFYLPSWRRAEGGRGGRAPAAPQAPLLVLCDAGTEHLARALAQRGERIAVVRPGTAFLWRADGSFEVDPGRRADFERVLDALGDGPVRCAHLWLAGPEPLAPRAALRLGFFALQHLADALESRGPRAAEVCVLTRGACDVLGEDVDPGRAAVLGACRVLPQERPALRIRSLDLAAGELSERALARLLDELAEPRFDGCAALRGEHLFEPAFEPAALPAPAGDAPLRRGGVYLITGGLGGIGLALAEHLFEAAGARLVLCGRSGLRPGAAERTVRALEARGAEVLVLAADAAERGAMRRAFDAARARFGDVHGVIHAAGVPGAGLAGGAAPGAALPAKVEGALLALELGAGADFVLLCSALAVELGGLGQADYCAGNAFMDALALRAARARGPGAPRVLALNWDTWSEAGMAAAASVPEALRERHAALLRDGLSRREGVEVFRRVLAAPHARVLVSTVPLGRRLDERDRAARAAASAPAGPASPATGARVAGNPLEEEIVQAWTQILGVARPGPGQSFFDQGGNSLLATQMLGRLQTAHPGAQISLRSFFDDPTAGGLLKAIEAAEGAARPAAPSALERARSAAGPERRAALRDYLAEQVAAATGAEPGPGGDLAALDAALLAAHLTAALRRDLDLALYPHEIRRQATLDGLAELAAGELERLAELRNGRAAAEPAPPRAAPSGAEGVPVPAPAGAPNPRAAFLLSAPRSGSTLLRLMLSAHPRLFCPPELFLLDHESMRGWDADPFSELYRDGLVRAFMVLRGAGHAQAAELVRDLVVRDAPVAEVYRLLQREGHLLVDKTPSYAMSGATLARAERLFDAPRYVFLVRHPHAAIESFVRNRIDRVRRVDGDSYALGEENWARTYGNLAELGAAVGPERFRLVRFEDLLRDPEGVLRGLCALLGVPFDAAVLDPYGKGRMAGGPGDPHLFQRGALDPARGDAWRAAALPRPLGRDAARLAASFGYELPA